MDQNHFFTLVRSIFEQNPSVPLPNEEQTELLFRLTERMLEVNRHMNLTAITEPEAVILKHYVDSLTISPYLEKNATVIDVGCGAGFPSLPLAICRPDLKITAIDSTAKRIEYIRTTCGELGLTNLTPLVLRAEDGGKSTTMREFFDYATARAVAALPVLAELCLPYVRLGGSFLAMKSAKGQEELSAAKRAITLCGGEEAVLDRLSITQDGTNFEERCLIIVKKTTATPKNYPRNFSQISKKPL